MAVVRRPCSKCGKNRQEQFFTSPKGRVCVTCQKKTRQQTSRNARVKDIYGLTPQEYTRLKAVQGGRCAICKGQRLYNFDVDHDHKKERTLGMRASIRGLLCKRCNRQLLPAAWGSPEILRAAADYLENPPAQKVLRAGRTLVRSS